MRGLAKTFTSVFHGSAENLGVVREWVPRKLLWRRFPSSLSDYGTHDIILKKRVPLYLDYDTDRHNTGRIGSTKLTCERLNTTVSHYFVRIIRARLKVVEYVHTYWQLLSLLHVFRISQRFSGSREESTTSC